MNALNFIFEKIAECRPVARQFPGGGNPDDFEKAWDYWLFGSAVARKKKYELAAAYFERAIIEYPHFWLFFFTLAGCYGRLGRHDEAFSVLRVATIKALRTRPSRRSRTETLQDLREVDRKDKRPRLILKPLDTPLREGVVSRSFPL